MTVEGLGWPTDMVADSQKNYVYIGDRYGIKDSQSDPDKPGLFIVTESEISSHHPLDVIPAGLSMTSSNHLLVVCEHDKRGRSLRFFKGERSSDDIRLVEVVGRRIELQNLQRYLLQAVELNNDTFAISQTNKKRHVHRIIVINNSGIEVR